MVTDTKKNNDNQEIAFAKAGDEECPSALPTSAFVEKRNKTAFQKYISNIDWWLVFGFVKWYGYTAAYVVFNKYLLNAFPIPWTASAMQLLIVWLFVGIYWGFNLRPAPHFPSKKKFLITFIPLGALHFFVHVGAVVSMGLGAISFTHIVKALEPVITAVLSIIFLREFLNVWAYVAFIPVILGVSLASVKELDFNIWAFGFAMLSNLSGSTRSLVTKVTMKNKDEIGENLTVSNIYLVLTIIASVMGLPFVLFIEAPQWVTIWNKATKAASMWEKCMIFFYGAGSALFYYLSSDASFYCLDALNQVSYSVANTAKRVVLIVTSILVFHNKVTALGYVGMAIAIVGAFLYSIVK